MRQKQANAAKSESVEELKSAIKAKNALIDKIADECMPGELGESNEATPAELKKKLADLDKTYDRIKSSCAAGMKGPSTSELKAMRQKQANAAKSESVEELKSAIKAKNALIDKIADECMPGVEE